MKNSFSALIRVLSVYTCAKFSNDGLTYLVGRYVDDRPIAMILICHISFHTSCSYLGDVALCQSLVYDLLYRNVFGMAEEIEIGMKVSS